jgi:hypothetical protein
MRQTSSICQEEYIKNHNIFPKDLVNIPFPCCGDKCWSVAYFGVCECESMCPHKFDLKTGHAKDILEKSHD